MKKKENWILYVLLDVSVETPNEFGAAALVKMQYIQDTNTFGTQNNFNIFLMKIKNIFLIY